MNIFPLDGFDVAAYRSNYSDLKEFDDAQLLEHYRQHGLKEGRSATAISSREDFLSLLSDKASLLEIGVFDSPTLDFLAEDNHAKTIHYADWLSRDELVERAGVIQAAGGRRNPSNVPDIQWVLSQGYEQIDRSYDAIVSHHCIEHQPDLIRHFINIRSILSEGGWYLFSVPDKECCFDFFIPEATIVDVLAAYYEKREKPPFKSVLEHRVFTSQNFFDGVNLYDSCNPGMKGRFESAFAEYDQSDYVDVHCWQFTPKSFKKLVCQLAAFKLIPPMDELKVYSANGEFYVAVAFT